MPCHLLNIMDPMASSKKISMVMERLIRLFQHEKTVLMVLHSILILNVYHWDSFVPESPNYNKAYPWVAAKNTPVDFFETQVAWNNSVALSGGNDVNTFRLSYTNFDLKGNLPNRIKNAIP